MQTPNFDALVFDMDGTITRPALDFAAIRRELGFGPGDVALQIAALEPERQREAWGVVERHEEEALAAQELQDGMADFLAECRSKGLHLGLVTRNVQRSVDALCEKFDLCFDIVVTRDFHSMKPHPGPVLHMLEQWGVHGDRTLMVGDYVHDIDCGRAAGTRTCFFQNPGLPDHGAGADYTVHSTADLRAIVFGQD